MNARRNLSLSLSVNVIALQYPSPISKPFTICRFQSNAIINGTVYRNYKRV